MSRKMKCKVCGEKWTPRKGTITHFINVHITKHKLQEPTKQENESWDEYLTKFNDFIGEYFEED